MQRSPRKLLCLVLPLVTAGLVPAAAGQDHAAATLFTRVEDGAIRAVIEIEIHPQRHLYHTEIGGELDEWGEGYPGRPLRIRPRGSGVTWSAPAVPEPERYEDTKLGNWAYVHRGTIRVYLRGQLENDAGASEVRLEIDALTCSEIDQSCIRLQEILEPAGEGADAVFAQFPAELR